MQFLGINDVDRKIEEALTTSGRFHFLIDGQTKRQANANNPLSFKPVSFVLI
jgi:hypothetical protein